jgi:hypothetical protein
MEQPIKTRKRERKTKDTYIEIRKEIAGASNLKIEHRNS